VFANWEVRQKFSDAFQQMKATERLTTNYYLMCKIDGFLNELATRHLDVLGQRMGKRAGKLPRQSEKLENSEPGLEGSFS
jgi:hypothetical protein